MKTKELIKPLIIVLISALFFVVSVVSAFLIFEKEEDNNLEIGFVDIKPIIHFSDITIDKDTTSNINHQVIIVEDQDNSANNIYKNGIYMVNVVDVSNSQYITNLRLSFLVKSNVETYFRFKILEQFVSVRRNQEGRATEYTLVDGNNEKILIPFKDEQVNEYGFEQDYYYDSESEYFYFKNSVIADIESDFSVIEFIFPYTNNELTFSPKPTDRELHLAIIVEAVQAINGPYEHWGFNNPPWGGVWT